MPTRQALLPHNKKEELNMKKIYEAPTSELVYLASADIITASPIDSRVDNFDEDIIEIG